MSATKTNIRETYNYALGPGRDEIAALPSDANKWHDGAKHPGGMREDLSDIIYNISPEETPFMSAIGKSSADNTYFEWQIDELAEPVDNRFHEGHDEWDADAHGEPRRIGNYTQISGKSIRTSGTVEAVNFAGRKSSMAYQMAKKAKELKIDMETMLLSADGMDPGSGPGGTPRATGGVGAWIQTNLINATATASAWDYGKTPPTAGAAKAVDEQDLRDCIKLCWDNGAKPTVVMVDGALKMAISQLSQSVSELRTAANNKSPAYVVAAVDIYVSDFGNLQIVPNRWMPEDTAYLLDYDFWDIAYLRPFQTVDLAKTGDSQQKMMIVEYGLRSKNEAANGAIHGWDADYVAP
jgi:hypothetical protein